MFVAVNRFLLQVRGLKSYFDTHEGVIRAVDDISFEVGPGETLGIVGESGCGKSVTALSIMQLLPLPKGKIVDGTITYTMKGGEAIHITSLHPRSKMMREIRGNEISMIFQEPMTSLNPVYTVGEQIIEAIRLHQQVKRDEAKQKAIEMLRTVRISAPEKRVDEYPHEFSGGMRQRAMIAMALSCNPSMLIADEPTTALDVTIEAQILEMIKELQKDFNMSLIMITHDLGVIGEVSDRVVVMYTGKIVERADVEDIFHSPAHPYTQGLLKSIPQIGKKKHLIPVRGSVPHLINLPKGCHFEPRCSFSMDRCREEEPPAFEIGENHRTKCWLFEKEGNLSE
jgi:oligopeptide/dipeptide ABC transporter ATP-binding protein